VGCFSRGGWTRAERNHLILIGVLFVGYALFASSFEQAGSTLNLFADRNTNNSIFGWSFPSSWFQSVNALFVDRLRANVRLALGQAGRSRKGAGGAVQVRRRPSARGAPDCRAGSAGLCGGARDLGRPMAG
jgi:hypothetical protein